MIPVTKAFLPTQDEYQKILGKAWDKGWITNRGTLVKSLEDELKTYLGVTNMVATTNGTLPLQIAIKALDLKGEIITTPFSYVATTSSIVWENCKPIFVDIHPDYLTIDETKIVSAITSNTSAILATHVFGNPSNVEEIECIAKKYDLKVIYDAAHCFGVKYKGKSIFEYGDVSTCSFHATKLFHTGEGGGLFTTDNNLYHKLFYHHNFGHKGEEDFEGLGINAKMSELQAAMGLAVLPYISKILEERKAIIDKYLESLNLSIVKPLKIRANTDWNYSYFPLIFKNENHLLSVKKCLNSNNIFPRRYFYPSLNLLPYLETQSKMPVAESISKRILCMPLYCGLQHSDIEKIVKIINESKTC